MLIASKGLLPVPLLPIGSVTHDACFSHDETLLGSDGVNILAFLFLVMVIIYFVVLKLRPLRGLEGARKSMKYDETYRFCCRERGGANFAPHCTLLLRTIFLFCGKKLFVCVFRIHPTLFHRMFGGKFNFTTHTFLELFAFFVGGSFAWKDYVL